MRYTEARLARIADGAAHDSTRRPSTSSPTTTTRSSEPSVLPAKFPQLLVNGSGGIAVGMATNIPPHNLGEIIDATIAIIRDPDITIDELLQIVPGPDFPTAGLHLRARGHRASLPHGPRLDRDARQARSSRRR
jgi:DNA gyrase subunit A